MFLRVNVNLVLYKRAQAVAKLAFVNWAADLIKILVDVSKILQNLLVNPTANVLGLNLLAVIFLNVNKDVAC